MVETVDVGDADILHRLLLNQADPLLPLIDGGGTGAGSIQDGAYLPLRDERVEHRLVELPHALGLALIDIYGIVAELVDNLSVGHLHHLFEVGSRSTVLLHHGAHLLAVHLGVLDLHLTHHVEVQFEHLSDFLVEGHLRQLFLNFRLRLFAARDSGLLCIAHCGSCEQCNE